MAAKTSRMGSTIRLLSIAIVMFFLTLQPYAVFSQGVMVTDTVFTPSDYPDGILDGTLFSPSSFNGTAVVLVHELGTARSTMEIWGDTLAAHGFLALSIDYPDPVNSGATFPEPVRAVVAGVQFLRSMTSESPVVSRVGVLGRSLGALLAAEAKMNAQDYALLGIDSVYSGQVDFDVLLYGLYDFQHFLTSTLPLSTYINAYFDGNASLEDSQEPVINASDFTCPILLIHGTEDNTLQYEQSLSFYDSLKANGRDADLITVQDAGHLFETNGDSFTALGLPIKDSVLQFLNKPNLDVTVSIQNNEFQVFPCPVNQGQSIHFTGFQGKGNSIIAAGITGAMTILTMDRDGNDIQIGTDVLSPGIYFLRPMGGQATEDDVAPVRIVVQ